SREHGSRPGARSSPRADRRRYAERRRARAGSPPRARRARHPGCASRRARGLAREDVMDEAAIVEASRREHALYGELVDVYASLGRALAGDAHDPESIAVDDGRAEAATDALRVVTASLAPLRLSGAPVSEEARALWRDSARLAAEAARANAALAALVEARRSDAAARLAQLAAGRH